MAAKDIVVTIGVDAKGTPEVNWPNADDCTAGDHSKPCGYKGKKVTWQADSSVGGRAWVVVFPDGTPFKHGEIVFHAGDPDGKAVATGEFEYGVGVVDPDGKMHWLDPKIQIQEDEDPAGGELTAFADQLDEWAAAADQFSADAREMAAGLRTLSAGLGESSSGQA